MILSRIRTALYGARQITPVLRPTHRYAQYPKSMHIMHTYNAEKLVEKEQKPHGLLSGILPKKEDGPLCAYQDSKCPPFQLPDIPDKADDKVVEVVPTYELPPRRDVPFAAILGYRFILFAAKVGFVIYFIRWTWKEGVWGSGEESSEAWARLSGNFHVLSSSPDHSESKSLAEHWNHFVYYTFDKIVQGSSNMMNKLFGPGLQDEDKLEYLRKRLLQNAEKMKDSPEYYGTRPSSAIATMVAESKSGNYESDTEVQKLAETGQIMDEISEMKKPEIGEVVDKISVVKVAEIGEMMHKTSEKPEAAEATDQSSTTTAESKEGVDSNLDVKMTGILKCAKSTECSPVQKNVLQASSELPEEIPQLPDLQERVKICCPFPEESEQSKKSTPHSSE